MILKIRDTDSVEFWIEQDECGRVVLKSKHCSDTRELHEFTINPDGSWRKDCFGNLNDKEG